MASKLEEIFQTICHFHKRWPKQSAKKRRRVFTKNTLCMKQTYACNCQLHGQSQSLNQFIFHDHGIKSSFVQVNTDFPWQTAEARAEVHRFTS